MTEQTQNATQQQVIMTMAVSPTVAKDGTLFAVTSDGALLCSTREGEDWQPVKLPGSGLAMSVALSPSFDRDGLMWVSLPEGVIAWSNDRGKTWRDTYVTRKVSAASVLAPSPALASDGLVLAATLEDGVLRSMDRGRTWSPANFGLLDLKTLGLAVCPSFANEQIALVATETALFRSRNGGLSWKEVGFWEDAVQSLAFSPDFAHDRRAWAGTEHSGLFTSADGGLTWQVVESFPHVSINALAALALPQPWLLAGTTSGLHASKDMGASWTVVLPDINVLALATGGEGDNLRAFAATETGDLYVCRGRADRWTLA